MQQLVRHQITGLGGTSVPLREARYSSRVVTGPNMEKARSRQSGHVFIEIDAKIDVGAEITNRLRWKNGVAIDDDRIEGASDQAASRAQPDELCFRSIQYQVIARHPTAHDLDAVSEPIGELGFVTGETVIINLKIICIPVDEEPQLSGNLKHIGSVENEIQRTKHGALRNAILHNRC